MAACTIPLKACDSSQIQSYGYDAATKTLAIHFRAGKNVYTYPGFEPEQFAAFDGSESKGRHFGQHIKGREFVFADLPEAEESAKA